MTSLIYCRWTSDPSDFATFRLRHGDILLNEGQSTELVGRPAMWRDEIPECCFQNTLVRFRSDPGKTVPEFALEVFLFYLRSGQFARISSKERQAWHILGRVVSLRCRFRCLPCACSKRMQIGVRSSGRSFSRD